MRLHCVVFWAMLCVCVLEHICVCMYVCVNSQSTHSNVQYVPIGSTH